MRGKIIPLLFAALALTSALVVEVSASPLEIDATAIVYKVIDGDTFDAFPAGRVRLADIDAPEKGEPGYNEATEALKAIFLNKKAYLDVDDTYVMDKYNRLICLVYVRHNSTHILNVNLYLVTLGHAVISDYANEFNPYGWKLFTYLPVSEVPETYDELLGTCLKLRDEYEKLKSDYDELKSGYDKLKTDYASLNAAHSKLKIDYDSLKVSYDKLKADYESLKGLYEALKLEHELTTEQLKTKIDELGVTTNLMNLFIMATMVLIGTTVYFVKKEREAAKGIPGSAR